LRRATGLAIRLAARQRRSKAKGKVQKTEVQPRTCVRGCGYVCGAQGALAGSFTASWPYGKPAEVAALSSAASCSRCSGNTAQR
jgi:hypothetical protein